MARFKLYLLSIAFLTIGCEEVLIEPISESPRSVFQTIWQTYDMHYGAFTATNIDWDSVYNAYDPLVSEDHSDDGLFDLMAEMLDNLKDPHVWLISNRRFHSYDRDFPRTFNESNISKYVSNQKKRFMYTYGRIDGDIGYIHVSTFVFNEPGFDFIDEILSEFEDCSGLILDVRNNAGGSEELACFISSRFYDTDRMYSYHRLRNGPKRNDLASPQYQHCGPSTNSKTDIPIILLTDQSVGSAGEDFTLMLKVLPHVTVVGNFTGGRPGGLPVTRELQNGWLFYIPTSTQYTFDDQTFLNKGISPDILVTETVNGSDLIIEKAIEILH